MLLNWSNSQGLNALMNSAEFIAGFADKGSGEVDLVLSKGTGSATFTRATTATTVNSSGTIVSVASGTPRSYYDPTTLAYMGYLAEGARTNLCLQSQDLATTWTTSNITISTNQTTAPDGTATADAVLEAATTTTHFVNQIITISASTTYTTSVFVKGLNRTWCAVEMIGVDAAGRFAYFNLSGAGAVGTTSGTTSTNIKAYSNGWYRCTIVADSGVGAGAGAVRVYSASADNTVTFLGNTSNGVYAWGAQLEAGSFASTYIPTTTASVTRNADVLTYPFSGNALDTAGSVYAELSSFWSTIPTAGYAIDFSAANGGALVVSGGISSTVISIFDGTTLTSKTGLSAMATASRKRASSWGGAGVMVGGDGAAMATGTFDGSMGSTSIGIGNTTSGGNQWFGTIRNVRIYQTQLSASQLQAVTA